MSRKSKRTLSMCLTLVLIIGLAGWLLLRPEAQEEDVPRQSLPTLTIKQRLEREISSITFRPDGQQSYAMVASANDAGQITWLWQDAPDYILNPAAVREKVRLAWSLVATAVVHENYQDIDLADFGLASPPLIIESVYYDGTTSNIYVGSPTVGREHYFVMVTGDPAVYMVANHFIDRTTIGLDGLLDRSLPEFFSDDAEHVLIAVRDAPIIELAMAEAVIDAGVAPMPLTPDGLFLRMIQPLEGRNLNHSRLDALVFEPLDNLQFDRVVSVSPGNLAPYGLDNPMMEFMYHDYWGEVHLFFGDIFICELGAHPVPHIYVKFADRPHIFAAEFGPISELFDINIYSIIDRFIALIDIRDVESIITTRQGETFNMVLNHSPEEGSNSLEPTINGQPVVEAEFRIAYRLLIAISADGEVETFTPQGQPDTVIQYLRKEGPDVEIRLFAVDNNFYAVSINGADAMFVTNQRDVQLFFNHVLGMME